MIKRYYIVYSGRVQGVGFRYNTKSIAQEKSLTGWVKNSDDGKVEIEAQGSEDALTAFMQALQDSFFGYITNSTAEEIPVCGQEEGFHILF